MTITVLGASGFIGSNLAEYFVARGELTQTPSREDLAAGHLPENLGDVFYCVGSDNWRDPSGLVEANFGLMQRVLDHGGFRSFIYLSSSRLYLGATETDEGATLSIQPTDPGRLYNAAKILAETYCLGLADDRVKVVRLSNVVGIAPKAQFFLPVLIRNALQLGRIRFSIAETSTKDYVHIDDVVAFLHRMTGETRHRLYNFASGVGTNAGDIAKALRNLTGCEVVWEDGRQEISFPPLSISRVTAEFGAPSPCNPIDYLPAMVEQYKNLLAKGSLEQASPMVTNSGCRR